MRKHLVIASYDGISTYYCGIGTAMQDTIASLNELVNSEKIKISLAYISADPRGSGVRCHLAPTNLLREILMLRQWNCRRL
ncbi:MAG: hypothetical protein WCW14_01910 [Candidatus Paceibacterota bacterium]